MRNEYEKQRPRAARRPDFSAAGADKQQNAGRRPRADRNMERNAHQTPRVQADINRVRRLRNTENRGFSASNSEKEPHRNTRSGVRSGRELVYTKKEQRALVAEQKEINWQNEVERVRGGFDKIMLVIVILLLALGALMVYSASYPTALNKFADSFYYLKKHLIYMAIGGVLMLVASYVPYTWFKKWGAFAAYGVAIVLLLAVLVIGTAEGEAKRWIYIGGFSIQPTEIMKVSLVLILAWYIDKYQKKMKERISVWHTIKYNTFYPLVFVGVACALILLEKHLSGTFITGVIGLAVMLVGGCHMGYSLGLSAGAGALAAGAFIALNPYALARLTTFTSENVDTLDEGWQTAQGILAIGSGGLFGVGFSESYQKYGYVSMAHNDFIYTIWCEELGFVGAVFLILLFLAFMWRGYVIAMRAPDTFSMLTVFGITTQVGLQALLNMMVVCDIIPNTGISLPFFSYGGSSLIMLMAEMGVILSISRHYYRKKI